jgi:hypothetical protein
MNKLYITRQKSQFLLCLLETADFAMSMCEKVL